MLGERDRRLLAACVDGQLSSRQKKQADRLLQRSSEARKLLKQLQEDASALRQLPQASLQNDLSLGVLRTIQERGLRPGMRRRASRSGKVAEAPFPVWSGWVAAAVVLLLVGGASYLYFVSLLNSKQQPPIAHHNPEVPEKPEAPQETPAPKPEPAEKPPSKPTEKPSVPAPPALAHKPDIPPRPLEPKQPLDQPDPDWEKLVNTGPGGMERVDVRTVEAVLPRQFSLGVLNKDRERRQLLSHLGARKAFRVEILTPNAANAYPWLAKSLASEKVKLVVDGQARRLLRKSKGLASYAVYVEGLSAEGLLGVLAHMGARHRKGLQRKPRDIRLDGPVVVAPMTRLDKQALTTLLGLDPFQHTPTPQPKTSFKIDPSKPLSEVTAEQVALALAGKGPPRPGSQQAPPANGLGFVQVYPVQRFVPSAEVKRFHNWRKPIKEETLRVLLVLRTRVR